MDKGWWAGVAWWKRKSGIIGENDPPGVAAILVVNGNRPAKFPPSDYAGHVGSDIK